MKRIAICGFNLESNRFASSCNRKDFEEHMYFQGEDISCQARSDRPSIHLGVCGFYKVMDDTYGGSSGWEACPAVLIGSTPAGPVEKSFFDEFLSELRNDLKAIGPVDGVYICQHGGAIATHSHDPDGELFITVRDIVGPSVPVIATLDLHANVSEEMMEATDILIGYRTNPHVDLYERGEEAARSMLEMFDGVQPTSYRIRLPLVAPSVTQLTAPGYPYGELIQRGQTYVNDTVMNVTILAGFAFADTPKNGMTIIVTTRDDFKHAKESATELAVAAWLERSRYRPAMISLDEAVGLASETIQNPALPALLFADPADNPGGGGRGNTTTILSAFLDAGIRDCVLAVFYDSAAVNAAFAVGEGACLPLTLNSAEDNQFSEPVEVTTRVERLSNGQFVGEYGMVAGKTVDTGRTAVLDVGGVRIVAISQRQQCLSTDYLTAFGIDPANCRVIVVKSRGHFRAGFEHLFNPDQIYEVDVPGLTSPNLATFDWQYLPRPVFPLDIEAAWSVDQA
ncbi:MAG: M81 family metallopeptidase [Pseudomonadota bacterium]|nr:M81 family metallopeptidase [Pseudomonadota bacterium]